MNENKPKQHEVTDNQPNEGKQGEVTEQDNKLMDNEKEKTENENTAKQGEVTEQDNELKDNENENAANANSDNKRTEEKREPMGDEETEIIQDTDSKLYVQNEVNENKPREHEVTEQDNELQDNKKERTENENAANANSDNKRTEEKREPMGDEETEIIQDTDSKLHVQNEVKQEVAEKDESKDNQEEKTENEIKAKQGEVTEQDELKDNREEKTEKTDEGVIYTRMCRRFLKFASDVVRVCMGKCTCFW